MSTMTWEKIRDHHLGKVAYYTDEKYPRAIHLHQAMADFITAHLAQPAQAVDVGEPIAWAWHSDGMKGWALGHVKPTPENTERFHERNTIVRGLYFDPSALSGEKSGRVDGIAMASAYIQKKADDYAAENCGTEWDTGATTYRYGQAGEDYHHTLLELAEELAALPASPTPDKEG